MGTVRSGTLINEIEKLPEVIIRTFYQ